MFTAGFPKILGGWLDPSTQATRGHLLNQYFVRERQELLAEFAVRFDVAVIWEFLDWATIIFEIGFLVAVWKAGWTRLFVCFAAIFHFSTMMTLNIAFLPNFLAYAAFIKWEKVYSFLTRVQLYVSTDYKSILHYRSVWVFAILLGVLFLVVRLLSNAGFLITYDEPSLHEFVFLSGAVLLVAGLSTKKLLSYTGSE